MTSHIHNQQAWDSLARQGHRFCRPAVADDLADPLTAVDPAGWLGGDIRGWRVLCLAAGGGRQGPLYAAAGAEVTVVDISGQQLAIDREVAKRHDLSLQTVQTPMDQLSMFDTAQFDLVVHPVSTCYVSQPQTVFAAVAHVTRPGGIYISQHKSPQNMQTSLAPNRHGCYEVVRAGGELATGGGQPDMGSRLREPGTVEYVHSLASLVGGVCAAGFVVEALVEPAHGDPQAEAGSFSHRCYWVPPYVRLRARRVGKQEKLLYPCG